MERGEVGFHRLPVRPVERVGELVAEFARMGEVAARERRQRVPLEHRRVAPGEQREQAIVGGLGGGRRGGDQDGSEQGGKAQEEAPGARGAPRRYGGSTAGARPGRRVRLAGWRGSGHRATQPRERRHPMKTRIFVTLKPGVLDPQGRAIHHALDGLGFTGVDDVRQGKLIELDHAEPLSDETLDAMCRRLLANTVIESYRIERAPEAMRSAVIVFPGSNCDRDLAVALHEVTGRAPVMLWHRETALPDGLDLVAVPGGFSYGDYLRSGAMAARSPVMRAVAAAAGEGLPVLGVCNGFQVLTEAGLLPGALMRNAGLAFVSRPVALTVDRGAERFTRGYEAGQAVTLPVAHHDGNYVADPDTLDRLEGEGQVAFRYAEPVNGSARDIAGIVNEAGNVLGLMPHPERALEPAHGNIDGRRLFEGLLQRVAA